MFLLEAINGELNLLLSELLSTFDLKYPETGEQRSADVGKSSLAEK